MATHLLSTISASDCREASQGQILVTASETGPSVKVHHREIPELHAHGETPRSAAVNLEQDLAREIEGVADACRREPFLRAITDVRAFIKTTP